MDQYIQQCAQEGTKKHRTHITELTVIGQTKPLLTNTWQVEPPEPQHHWKTRHSVAICLVALVTALPKLSIHQ